MTEILGNTVGQGPFELSPDKLIGIELWGIAWKEMGMEAPVSVQEPLDQARPVGAASVPQKDDTAPEVSKKVAEEVGHVLGPDVFVGVKLKGKRQPLSFGREAKGRDGRNLGPVARHWQDRGVASGCPGLGKSRNQQEPTFIKEHQMGSKPFGLFLYGATRGASNSEWRLPSFPGLASGVSGNSNPEKPLASSNWQSSSVSQSAWRSPPRCVLASTDPWDSQPPEALAPESAVASSFAWGPSGLDVQEWAWAGAHRVPFCGRPGASAPLSLRRRLLERPRNDSCGRIRASEWRVAFAFAIFPVFHRVSCPIG
jgi:hypothetical protein